MSIVAPRLGRLVKMIAVAGAMVANQASSEYLAHQTEVIEQPPTEDLVVGEFYYL